MRFLNRHGELDGRVHTRTYGEEVVIALSAFDSVLNGEKAVYASSELTTGKRLHALFRQHGVRSGAGLREKLGAAGESIKTTGIKAAAGAILPGSGPLVDAVNNLRQAAGAVPKEAVNRYALPTTELIDKIRGKINEIVEGRSKAPDPRAFFNDLLKMLRDQLKEGGTSEKDIESELARAIEQGKRRGIDGTSGGR